jgi:hypothetical protein
MKPAFGRDIDPVDGVAVIVEMLLDRDGAFVGDFRFTGVSPGNEGDGGLHEWRKFLQRNAFFCGPIAKRRPLKNIYASRTAEEEIGMGRTGRTTGQPAEGPDIK